MTAHKYIVKYRERDLNPRMPTQLDLKSSSFDQARKPRFTTILEVELYKSIHNYYFPTNNVNDLTSSKKRAYNSSVEIVLVTLRCGSNFLQNAISSST